ncbi:MAG: gliding motility lipoprotein GldH [Bacteroidales bacterium]|nr:gliding motility lipoprotein GldH [Bacteroidales bacterium]MBO7529077.1 gliding motility lipoprotein GldH [Bacteroidales bacterium]MBQ3843838.1 gliding motility lipoprotein GldH [Bacteroidales bacterium]
MKKLIIAIAITLLMFSCGRNTLYDESVVFNDAKWDNENFARFDVTVDDTLTDYAFYLNIRHLENYRYSNLFIFMHTEFPNGNVTHDTIECTFARHDGRWISKGSGTFRSAKIMLNPALRFPLKGDYHFEIEQAMREKELKGISDIGICFEKQ